MTAINNYFYETDAGKIMKIRLSQDSHDASPTNPAGPATAPGTVRVGGSRKAYGVHARRLYLSRTLGSSPNTYKKRDTLVIETKTDFDTLINDATIEVGTTTWNITGYQAERIR